MHALSTVVRILRRVLATNVILETNRPGNEASMNHRSGHGRGQKCVLYFSFVFKQY